MHNYIEKLNKLSEEDSNPLHNRGQDKSPMMKDYQPEIDAPKQSEDKNMYRQLVGILRWACELGRIDILTEVSVISQHLCNPREGRLYAVFHIFNYFNVKRTFITGKLGFDYLEHPPYIFPIKGTSTEKKYWVYFYPDAEDRFPNGMLDPLGWKFRIRAYDYTNHSGNLINRRFHSGIII